MHILLRLPINVYKLIMQTKASYPPKNGRKSHIGVGQLEHFQVIEELFILGERV